MRWGRLFCCCAGEEETPLLKKNPLAGFTEDLRRICSNRLKGVLSRNDRTFFVNLNMILPATGKNLEKYEVHVLLDVLVSHSSNVRSLFQGLPDKMTNIGDILQEHSMFLTQLSENNKEMSYNTQVSWMNATLKSEENTYTNYAAFQQGLRQALPQSANTVGTR